MGSEISSSSSPGTGGGYDRRYLKPGDGLHAPPGTPSSTNRRSHSVSHSVSSLEFSPSKDQNRKSFSHFSDFSLYPDRFDSSSRCRTLSTGSDPNHSSPPREEDGGHLWADKEDSSSPLSLETPRVRKISVPSSTHRFNFFDYSMIPDKDPKSVSKP